MKRFLVFVSLCLFGTSTSHSQQKPATPAHADHAAKRQVGAARPSTAAIRLQGMGAVHHKVTTSDARAQAYFDQGLALIYAFNHEEAARSFRKAAEIDPKLAMAWWGVAFTDGSNYNMPSEAEREKAAAAAIKKAVELAPGASQSEQDYIAALNKRYSEDPKADLHALGVAYKDAMFELSRKYPDDLDAATLAAESGMNLRPWALWSIDGKPAEGTEEIVATLESVLKRDPNQIGANHYYIHAVEASPLAARALPSADRLGALAPGAGHLVHMPSHIYSRVGDFDAAVRVNIAAAAADEKYFNAMDSQGIYPMMYYSHNIHFQSYADSMEGRYADAIASAKKLEAHTAPHVKEMAMLEGFASIPVVVEERFGKWDDILAMKAPPENEHFHTLFWHFARGMAFAAKGKLEDAKKEYDTLAAAEASIPADQMFVQNKAKTIASIADGVLSARIAESEKRFEDAESSLTRAVDTQDHLKYIEPPEWFYPVRENLGGLYLRANKPEEAEKVFRADLEVNPRNGRSLIGLVESLKMQKKTKEAELVQSQLDAAWKKADTKVSAGEL
jgi:tetratricopeptide (TPR) repeat protein